ncbi:MAG: AbrB/MazE/SpoVT family DNA-binding domain-containing protein [Ectobacillus sp.]
MKGTGITRKVDELGRIVLPIELRRILGVEIKDPLEIFVEKDRIILKKYSADKACQITGDVSNRNVSLANGKITLSLEGAELLLKELEDHLTKA